MREDKALLTCDDQSFAARSLNLLKGLCESVSLIGPRERYDRAGLNVEIFEDGVPSCGPLGGILTALHHAQQEYALILACDLPFMTEPFLYYMIGAALTERPNMVVPVDGTGEYQPLCALYSRACLPAIETAITAQQFKVSDFYEKAGRLRVIGTGEIRRFSPDFRIFTNVNTPEQWAEAKQMLGQNKI